MSRSQLARALALLLVTASVPAFMSAAPDGAARSRAWFVSTVGRDDNPGTEDRPFATVQRAADLVLPGDVVTIEDGVYTGVGAGTPCAPSTKPVVCVTGGGTSTAPVTFRARHPLKARLSGRNNSSTDGFRLMSGVSYVRIEGFEIFGMGNESGSASGIELYAGGYGSVIAGNDIHDIGRLCTHTTNGQVGVFIEQPHVTVTQNQIHDIGRYMVGENGCTVGYNASTDHGIYVNGNRSAAIPGADDVVIDRNVFYNNKRGWSVQLYAGTIARARIVNNTFAFGNPYQDGYIVLGAPTVDSVIANNTFYSPRTAAIYYYRGTDAGLQIRDNTVAGAALMTAMPSGATVDGNRTVAAMSVVLP